MPDKIKKTERLIPIMDCPICEAKDVPLSYVSTFTKKDKPDIEVWQCTNCGKVPNLSQDIKIKRFINIKELEAMGWEKDK